MTKDEAMQQALEALKESIDVPCYGGHPKQEAAYQALQEALANEALDKKAENARELGLDYELPITMQEGEFDCTHAERLCAELKAAHPVTPCTHPNLGFCSLREDGTAARWGCVMCGIEFVPKATQRWAEFNETTKRNIEHAEWYLSTHPQPAQQGLSDLDVWKARALQAEAVIAKFMAEPPAQRETVATDWERIARVQNAKLMAICDEPKGFEKLCEVMDRYERTSPPPQRTWVGLTDEEIDQLVGKFRDAPITLTFAIEAKLKEKNT